ncbi:MAG: hypothetical protein ACYDIC_02650 [Desulfobaccales bacterium]
MNKPFKFFIRLLLAFLLAQFVLRLLGAVTLAGLLGVSCGLVGCAYLFDFLDWYYGGALRRALKPAAIGWLIARLVVGMNTVEQPKERTADQDRKEG